MWRNIYFDSDELDYKSGNFLKSNLAKLQMHIPFDSVILLLGIYPTDISSSQIYAESG